MSTGGVERVPIERITPDPSQPRKRFSAEGLRELAASIRTQGILQPIVVRKAGAGYQLIAGERRLRAAKLAGFRAVPVIISILPADKTFPAQLAENLMRENLTPVEEARAYRQLRDRGWTVAEIARACAGGNEARVSYKLDFLNLVPILQLALTEGVLTERQAHVLTRLSPAGQNRAWDLIKQRGLVKLQRVATAIKEQERQAKLFQVDSEKAQRDRKQARRFLLQLEIAERAIARCFKRAEPLAVDWVLAADLSRAIPRLTLLIRTLAALRRQLLRADGRRLAAGMKGERKVETRRNGPRIDNGR